MNTKKYTRRAILAIIAIMIVAMVIISNDEGYLLSEVEINQFLTENNIIPTYITNIEKAYSIIVCDEEDGNGLTAYYVRKNKKGKIKTQKVSFYDEETKDDYVVWGIDSLNNQQPGYVAIIINNEDMKKQAYKGSVVLDNGVSVDAQFQNGMTILPATKKHFWQNPAMISAEILDKNSELINGFYTKLDLVSK